MPGMVVMLVRQVTFFSEGPAPSSGRSLPGVLPPPVVEVREMLWGGTLRGGGSTTNRSRKLAEEGPPEVEVSPRLVPGAWNSAAWLPGRGVGVPGLLTGDIAPESEPGAASPAAMRERSPLDSAGTAERGQIGRDGRQRG